MNREFWNNKTVLLTGHTGFKGSWLTMILKKLGCSVIGYSLNIPTRPSLFELANVQKDMISIMDDIRDYDKFESVIEMHKPEIVIHMAAQSLVRQSYQNPVETYSTNIMGTVNLLEAVRKNGKIRVLLNITSDKCYKIQTGDVKYKEDDPMGGFDPYSSSKGCAELITSSYRNSFFNTLTNSELKTSIASVRAGNVIGGGDWSVDRLIPDLIKGALDKSKIMIRNPSSIRPWQYVLDPLFGYLKLVEKLWTDGKEFSEGWNFGPLNTNNESVQWIVEKLNELWGEKIDWDVDSNLKPHEEKTLRLDCSKAKKYLGWESKMDLETALVWTVNWYKAFKNGDDMETYSGQQIDKFMKLAAV